MTAKILFAALAVFCIGGATAGDFNFGPFFERDSQRDFTAVRPFWSRGLKMVEKS